MWQQMIFKEVHESGLPMIASSDMHRATQITSLKTVLQCEKNSEAVKEAIKKAKS